MIQREEMKCFCTNEDVQHLTTVHGLIMHFAISTMVKGDGDGLTAKVSAKVVQEIHHKIVLMRHCRISWEQENVEWCVTIN